MAHMVLLSDLLDHGFQALSGPINLGTQLQRKVMLVCNNLEVNNTINWLYKALFMNWIFK
jgi:virulence-associated protein VapD